VPKLEWVAGFILTNAVAEFSMEVNAETWDALISSFSHAHILQTWEWGQIKSAYGWRPDYRVLWCGSDQPVAAALILERAVSLRGLPLPLRVLYVPRGPLLSNWEDAALFRKVFVELMELARKRGAIFVKVDPDLHLGYGIPGSAQENVNRSGVIVAKRLGDMGWNYSPEQIQFKNTVVINLEKDESELLAAMKQKTRYNMRVAERKGVQVRKAGKEDIGLLFHMYAETALRDGFAIREQKYYTLAWTTFIDTEMAQPFIAEVDGEAVAALIVFRFGDRAWYMFGMSRDRQREKMPNYLLQWEAIKWAKAAGCREYDLWGAPDSFTQADPLWGVYRFKEGLGGAVVRTIGAWDYPVHPRLYRLYTEILPRILSLMRKRGAARMRQALDS